MAYLSTQQKGRPNIVDEVTSNVSATLNPLTGLAWLFACLLGVSIVAGSLSYQPDGRINLLWVWLLWAFLPAIGSVSALVLATCGGRRPWLFRWWGRSHSWYPDRRSRWRMLWQLQVWWCGVSASMLVTYGLFLLFTDLSFGWSSTLVTDPGQIHALTQVLAAPWESVWPAASPDREVVAATQFQRIDPAPPDVQMSAAWWPFLLASLLVYNFLPRAFLAVAFYWRWRALAQHTVAVKTQVRADERKPVARPLPEDALRRWQDSPLLAWEVVLPEADVCLGVGTWAEDQAAMDTVLASSPTRLCWWVEAERTPVAELADCIARADSEGVAEQGLYVQTSAATDRLRHIASWRAFAREHDLIWLT